MENSLLETITVDRAECLGVFNGYICTAQEILHPKTRASVATLPALASSDGMLGFYADGAGQEFKLVTATGRILRSKQDNQYAWETVGEMEETVISGCAFNPSNGNLLICSDSQLFLIDRNLNLVKQTAIKPEIQAEAAESGRLRSTAEWSEDGKYILVVMGSVVLVYRYDLSEIADTLTTCNRIMNSRLVRTKKYLTHESTYVDVARRVAIPGEPPADAEPQPIAGSVLFEERTRYKLARWHNQFSLVVAVTTDHRIFLLERNAFKFKEVQHLRSSDRAIEAIAQNCIVALASHNDYLYLLHRESQLLYFKTYYLKNNCVYLKSSINLNALLQSETIPGTPLVIASGSDETVTVATEKGLVTFAHRKTLNRTSTDVVCIDGARALLSTFALHLIPPPLFTRHLALEGVPVSLSCSNDSLAYQVITAAGPRECAVSLTSSSTTKQPGCLPAANRPAAAIFYNLPCHMRKTVEQTINLGGHSVQLKLDHTCLTVTAELGGITRRCTLKNTSSFAQLSLATAHLLVTQSQLSWTVVSCISVDEANAALIAVPIIKTGRNCRLLFVSPSHVVLDTEYGTLETFYPEMIVEYQMIAHAQQFELGRAVSLARRHGLPLRCIMEPILSALQSDRITPALMLLITKQLLAAPPGAENEHCLAEIETHALSRLLPRPSQGTTLHDLLSSLATMAVAIDVRDTAANLEPLCAVLVEIFLGRQDHARIVALARQFAPETAFSPETFSLEQQHPIARSIIGRAIPAVSKDELVQLCLSQQAYAVCYLVLLMADLPQDEINDLLLASAAGTINPHCPIEEVSRRYRIFSQMKNRPKQVIYAIKQQLLNQSLGSSNDGQATELASTPRWSPAQVAAVAEHLEKIPIRDYYLYLLTEPESTSADSRFGTDLDTYRAFVQALLLHAGTRLQQEGETKEALDCLAAAGHLGAELADCLRAKLGLWKELFATPANVTPANICRLEKVLLDSRQLTELADMHLAYGDSHQAAHYLTKAEEYTKLLDCLSQQTVLPSSSLTSSLISQTHTYAENLKNYTEKYQEHQVRLQSVRARKDQERAAILQNAYPENDQETASYSKSFITNSFMSAASGKKKKRNSKLRNTVGGRYEEEYVQYVLSEFIIRSGQITRHVETIEAIFTRVAAGNALFAAALSRFRAALYQFWQTYSPSVRADFLSLNTEEDPLYDPERPQISEPDPELLEYLQQSLKELPGASVGTGVVPG